MTVVLTHLFELLIFSIDFLYIVIMTLTGGTGAPNVDLGPPNISETTRARMMRLKTQLYIVKYRIWYKNFSARWRPEGVGPPSVNLKLPANMSKCTIARKLKLKTPLDTVKYSPRVHTFLARGIQVAQGLLT